MTYFLKCCSLCLGLVTMAQAEEQALNNISLKNIVVPIIQYNSLQGYFSFDIVIEVPQEFFTNTFLIRPKIRDKIFANIYSLVGALWLPEINAGLKDFKPIIEKSIKEATPAGVVQKVLFTNFGRSFTVQSSLFKRPELKISKSKPLQTPKAKDNPQQPTQNDKKNAQL